MSDDKLKQFDLYQDRRAQEGAIVVYVLFCAALCCFIGAALLVGWAV